jgi:hypothetical protein
MSFTKRMLFDRDEDDERVECNVGPCFGRAVAMNVDQTGMKLCDRCLALWENGAERTADLPLDERKRVFLERLNRELSNSLKR